MAYADVCAAFNDVSPKKAMSLCTPWPHDPTILVTQELQGMKAYHVPEVTAVILDREVAPAATSYFQALNPDEMQQLRERCNSCLDWWNKGDGIGWRESGLTTVLKGKEHPPPTAVLREITFQHHVFRALLGRAPEQGYVMGYNGLDGASTPAHIDSEDTLVDALSESGLKFFSGRVPRHRSQFLNKEWSSQAQEKLVEGMPADVLGTGQMIVFKGSDSHHVLPQGYLPGLLHCTPSPPATARQNGDRRFATSMFGE